VYRPAEFDEPDASSLLVHLSAVVPATLVTFGSKGLTASIIPMIFESESGTQGRLDGHLAIANPQWRDISADVEALAIFNGVDAYISPSMYATKRETGRVVPTWNYITVHVHGVLLVHSDPAWIIDVVRRLTERQEAARVSPWSIDDPPDGYVDGQARAVVGVELRVTRVEGKRKLSQNRSSLDVDEVIANLDVGTAAERALASEMRSAARHGR
jgi:transcriptional regulator